jgi:hypothetical protein
MYRWFCVVPQGLDVLFPFIFLVIFGAFSWRFSWSDFEAFLFGIWWGMYPWTLHGSFPFDSPPKYGSKGAQFWGFWCSRVRGVIGGISSIPLDLASFGGQNLSYGVPMRCSHYPQSLVQIRGVIRKIGSWIWGSWPVGDVQPESSAHTGLTGADSCWVLLGWTYGEFAVFPCCFCFMFGSVWSSVGLFGRFGVSWLEPVWPVSYIGLTSVGAFLWKFPGFTSRDRSDRWCSPALPV